MRLLPLIAELEYALTFSPFHKFIDEIAKTGLFPDQIKDLKNSNLYITTTSVQRYEAPAAQSVLNTLKSVRSDVESLLKSLKLISGLDSDTETTIYIRIPEAKDFENLGKISNSIQKIFGQLIFEEQIGGELKILSAEPGSIWFKVNVKTITAVSLIAGLAWSSAVVYKKIQEGRIFSEVVRQQQGKTEAFEKLIELQKFEVDLVIDIEAGYLQGKHFSDQDNERLARLKYSIKECTKLIDEGLKIEPALLTPEDVKDLFPDTKNLPGIFSRVKQISDVPEEKK
jgi:hypothetical protein